MLKEFSIGFSYSLLNSNSTSLLEEARCHFNQVSLNKWSSSYSPQNTITEEKCVYSFNCYGFVNLCIKNTSKEAYEELKTSMDGPLAPFIPRSVDGEPCPFNIHATFRLLKLKHWKIVKSISEIRPGDVISYVPPKYQPPRVPGPDRINTGTHVMIVDEVVKKQGNAHHLMIIDSTRSHHSRKDTRYPGKGGIGKSPVILRPDGKYTTVQWPPNKRQLLKDLAIGRPLSPQDTNLDD